MSDARPPFRWDRAAGRYRSASGRFVTPARVRSYLDDALVSAGKRMDLLATQLRSGQIDLISWEVRMRREVKVVATYSGAAAKGGWAQMTEADYGRVGKYVRDQYQFLRGFAQDVQSGKQSLGGINARAKLYAEAGRPLHHRVEKAEMLVRGNTERKSVRHSRDSCPGCIQAEAAGWRPIEGPESVSEIGTRDCRTRDRCGWLYRMGGAQ